MANKGETSGTGAKDRRQKAEETTRTAMALIEAERKAANRKTERLRAERLAREEAEAQAPEEKPAPKRKRR